MEAGPRSTTSRAGLGSLFRSPDFVRLWILGGIANAMRWVEMLAAALFTFEVTGSGMEVAFVSAARALPLLCFGAFVGVLSEAVNRKRILIASMLLAFAASLSICLLQLASLVQPWHIACAGFVSGTGWATEMATRRRMVGECAGTSRISRAVALDSLTGAFTRMIGPLLGSLSYARFGLIGAFGISATSYLLAALLAKDVRHEQDTRKLVLSRVPRELAEGFAFARTQPTVLAVLGVTMTMNLFAFSYVALVAPIARQVFAVSDALTGALAGAEPLGSLLGGMVLASVTPKSSPRAMMLGGSAMFLASLAAMPLMPSFALACGALVLGALGLALFSNMQTILILTRMPAAMRSRQLGLITVSMGIGPLGQILIGALTERFGPLNAVIISALLGLGALGVVAMLWVRAERPAEDKRSGTE
ncbi:MAG: MFS transporter [Hyphomicrobiales bacterium]